MPENKSTPTATSEYSSALELATKSLEGTSKAIADASTAINQASERFASRPPAQRASWLGFLLLFLAIVAKFAEAVMRALKQTFEFSDGTAAIMLIVGGILVIAAGAFETYYTVRAAQSLARKASELESQAAEARKEERSLISRLIGSSPS